MSEWKDFNIEKPPKDGDYIVKCEGGCTYRVDEWCTQEDGNKDWCWYNVTHWKEIDPVPEPKPEPTPSTFTWNYILPAGWVYKVDGGKKIVLNGNEVVAWAWEGDSDQSLLESVIYECSQEINDLAVRLDRVNEHLEGTKESLIIAMEKCYSA